jgi:hypothetical protein
MISRSRITINLAHRYRRRSLYLVHRGCSDLWPRGRESNGICQRLWGVRQLYRTLPDGSLQLKQPNAAWNQLHAEPQADPLIDGHLDPWLAPWDGNPNSCNSTGSLYFPN